MTRKAEPSSRLVMCCICAVCGMLSSGCSFLFVKSPPRNAEALPPSEPVECTSSRAAPLIDTALTAFQVVRTVYAITASDADYSGLHISRGMDIGLGVGLTALVGASMIHGFTTTNECIDAKAAHRRHKPASRVLPLTVTPPTSSAAPEPTPAPVTAPTEDPTTPLPASDEAADGGPPLPPE